MDRELTRIEQRKQIGPIWKWLVGVVVVLIVGVFGLRSIIRPSVDINEIVIATVTRGDIENTISASGQTEPAYETIINASIASDITNAHMRPGDEVQAGDLILSLNPEFIKLQVEALDDELALKKNNVRKSAVEHKKRVQDLAYENDILALNIQSMEASLIDLKRLREVGGATDGEVEEAALNLEVKELQKKKLENDLFYSREIFDSEQENLALEVNIKQKDLTKLRRKLQQTEVRTPSKGIVTWTNANIGEQVMEGSPLVRIADLSHFRIRGKIGDRYGAEIQIGQSVHIRIGDAMVAGHITSILPEVLNNTIEFMAEFDDDIDIDIKPNMNVEVLLVTAQKSNALLLRNGPGFTGAKQTDFFMIRDGYALRKRMNVGLVNTEFIELLDQTIQGQERIVISDMSKFDRVDRVKINE